MSDVVDESFGAEMVDDADGSEDVAVAREIGVSDDSTQALRCGIVAVDVNVAAT